MPPQLNKLLYMYNKAFRVKNRGEEYENGAKRKQGL